MTLYLLNLNVSSFSGAKNICEEKMLMLETGVGPRASWGSALGEKTSVPCCVLYIFWKEGGSGITTNVFHIISL